MFNAYIKKDTEEWIYKLVYKKLQVFSEIKHSSQTFNNYSYQMIDNNHLLHTGHEND